MKLTETKIIKIWQRTAEKLNGKFSLTFQQVNGGSASGGLYHSRINLKYKLLKIEIYSGLYEFPLQKDEYKECDILITAKKEVKEKIELAIWRKDFMDKIFTFRKLSTGWKEFDKVIGLRASRNIEIYLPKIFENEKLRKELIEDNYRAYNVQTIDNLITVLRKSALKMKSSEMIVSEYDRFTRFLDGLINARIL